MPQKMGGWFRYASGNGGYQQAAASCYRAWKPRAGAAAESSTAASSLALLLRIS
jgi:hypothetical protein